MFLQPNTVLTDTPTFSHLLHRRLFCDPLTSCLTIYSGATLTCLQVPHMLHGPLLYELSSWLLFSLPERPLANDFPPPKTLIRCDLLQEAFLECPCLPMSFLSLDLCYYIDLIILGGYHLPSWPSGSSWTIAIIFTELGLLLGNHHPQRPFPFLKKIKKSMNMRKIPLF